MRYFFDLIDGVVMTLDVVGDEFGDAEAARKMANALVIDSAHDGVPSEPGHQFACRVRDEGGRVIHRANLTFWTSRE